MSKAKQLNVDFEMPEAMLSDINKMMVKDFPAWIAKYHDNRVAGFRALWAGWLFLKYSEGISAKYGKFAKVQYQPYTAINRPLVYRSVMLISQYQDAMERMSRLYPDVYYDKSKDNNYFLAQLGYVCLRELDAGSILLKYDLDQAELIDTDNPKAQLGFAWLVDNVQQPFTLIEKVTKKD